MRSVRHRLSFSLSVPALLTILACYAHASAPVDYNRRIEALEARIDHLEQMVESLKHSGQGVSTELASAQPILETTSWNLPQAAAAQNSLEHPKFETPPELVPEIGKIGAEVGLLLSGSANPFKSDKGTFGAGFIDLPLFDEHSSLRGTFSYEISVGLSQAKTTFNTTSNVAQVANLSVLNTLFPAGGLSNVSQALTGTGAAPFAVTSSTESRLRLLQVVPFSIKYTPTALDRYRLRPYAIGGFGVYVTIHDENPARGTPASYGVRPDAQLPPAVLAAVSQVFGGTSPFGAPLVAGQISQSPELVARGLPGGNGNIDFGLHAGGGLAIRLNRGLSFGVDVRYNRIAGSNGGFTTYGSRLSLHF